MSANDWSGQPSISTRLPGEAPSSGQFILLFKDRPGGMLLRSGHLVDVGDGKTQIVPDDGFDWELLHDDTDTSAYRIADVPLPSGKDIYQSICDAISDMRSAKFVPPLTCEICGPAFPIYEGVFGIGFMCQNGHRLPGQDLPTL